MSKLTVAHCALTSSGMGVAPLKVSNKGAVMRGIRSNIFE